MSGKEFLQAKRRIVFSHIPPESRGWQGNRNVCELFVPVLNEAGIDLMICGHTHRYRFDTPDAGISTAEFPVLINPAAQRLEVTLAPDGVTELRIFDGNGAMTHSLKL